LQFLHSTYRRYISGPSAISTSPARLFPIDATDTQDGGRTFSETSLSDDALRQSHTDPNSCGARDIDAKLAKFQNWEASHPGGDTVEKSPEHLAQRARLVGCGPLSVSRPMRVGVLQPHRAQRRGIGDVIVADIIDLEATSAGATQQHVSGIAAKEASETDELPIGSHLPQRFARCQ